MTFISTAHATTASNRQTCLVPIAVSSLLCSPKGNASILSSYNVPPKAASNSPALARLASVKALASTPNSSASNNVWGIAAQLTSMNGPWARGLLLWMRRATSPLPVPVSPCSKTVGMCGLPTISKGGEVSDLPAHHRDGSGRHDRAVAKVAAGGGGSHSHIFSRATRHGALESRVLPWPGSRGEAAGRWSLGMPEGA